MTITSRAYRKGDFQRVRELLIESYAATKRIHNWWLDRWECFRYSGRVLEEMDGTRPWEADVRLWEDQADSGRPKLVGVVNPEDGGDFFIQIHPHYRHVEEEMVKWAEEHHRASRPADADRWPLSTFLHEHDQARAALLSRRGYKNFGLAGYTRRNPFDKPIPRTEVPAGYSVRNVRADAADLARRAAVANASFGHSKHNSDTIRVLQKAPTYRPNLDLVIVAPDGTFASYCVIWFGETNRLGWYEPVGTHPDHRRRGLAKAMMCEGLRRLKDLGAGEAYVGVGTGEAANRLYESVGFTGFERDFHWQKEF